jgi:hypothetical protein
MDADIGVRVSTHFTDARTGTRCRWYTRLAAEFTCPPAQARWWGDRDPATIGLSFGRDRTIVAEDLDDPAAAMAAVDAHIATRDARGTQQRRMPGTRSLATTPGVPQNDVSKAPPEHPRPPGGGEPGRDGRRSG